MTRRDFELIATVMLYARPDEARKPKDPESKEAFEARRIYLERREVWERAVKEFARVLDSTNPRFDRERFLRACGME